MTDEILREFGRVDVLVNNAGISISGLLTDIDAPARKRLFDVNVLGAIECTRLLLPQMVRRQSGCIVNISSMWGQVGASCEVDYSAAKAALIGFTKALAQEVAPSGIRVNCIAPGVIRTPMLDCYDEQTLTDLAEETPLGRLGTPEDIVKIALINSLLENGVTAAVCKISHFSPFRQPSIRLSILIIVTAL